MAGLSIDSANLAFINYLHVIGQTLNQKALLRNLISEERWAGASREWRVHSARSPAIGFTVDGGAFPIADKQDYQTAKVARRFLAAQIQLSDGAIAAIKGENAAISAVESEIQGAMTGALKYFNGVNYRDGSGVMGVVQTGTSGTTLLVDDARMLWDKASFDVYDTTLATNRGQVKVVRTASAPTAAGYATVTLEASVPGGTTAGDKLVWANGSQNSLNLAVSGLDKLVDDAASSFQNINVSNFPRYSSFVLDNGGTLRDLTPFLFRAMMAGIKQKSGNERPEDGLKVLGNSWSLINVEELYEGEFRISPSDKTAGMAVSSFQSALGKIDIIVDTDALYNRMFFVDFSQIKRGVVQPLSWRRQGGEIFLRSDNAGVNTATMLEISENYIINRHTSGKIEDLNEDKSTMY